MTIWGETNKAFKDRVTTPTLWFAWHPVVLQDGRRAWLCLVLRWRRPTPGGPWPAYASTWDYCLPDQEPEA